MSSYKNGIHMIILIIAAAFLINYMIPSYAQGVTDIQQNFENVSLNLEENNLFPLNNFSLTSSTMDTSNNTWSPMYGDVISVDPKGNYIIISHMGLNEYAMQSHIVISGFNETSKTWSQILQCPNGMNGPLELNRFVCPIVVPANITKMVPIFQSGWSSGDPIIG
ncbi:MAG: hypothetical protein P0116_11220 [Candidatus Nitrosocosmicus sp.]|nr:hypothetical protein [Candidatus Nitrosocosmicus sp.]